MNIDLSNFINKDEMTYDLKGEISNDTLKLENDDSRTILSIEYSGAIYKIDGSHSINLEIIYKYKTKCARCLKDVIEEEKTHMNGNMIAENAVSYEVDDDDNIIFLEDDILEIEDIVISEVNSSIPMKVLCEEDCKGLCLKCGVDLNKEICDCTFEYQDPRLAKLKDLFSND